MNKARRSEIKDIIESLENVKVDIEMVADDEQDAFDRLPEGLQCSERGEQMEEYAETLCEASSNIDDIIEMLESVIK